MDNMDNFRDDDRKIKKPKEYYQINLDMGRIFWIVFILGLVVIGIFVLGFYIGGGSKKSSGLFGNGKNSLQEPASGAGKELNGMKAAGSGEKRLQNEGQKERGSEEISIEDLFKSNEIEIESAGKEQRAEVSVSSVEKNVSPVKTRSISKSAVSEKVKKSSYAVKKSAKKITGNYYIQVASFKNKNNALALKKRLEKDLYKVKIEERVINGVKYYRVRVGPFPTKNMAKNTMIAMKKRYRLESPFVVVKK